MFDDSIFAVAVETATNPLVQLARNGPVFIKNNMTRPQFHAFLLQNGDVKIERDRQGTITIHPPMTLKSGFKEAQALLLTCPMAPLTKPMARGFLPKNSPGFRPKNGRASR